VLSRLVLATVLAAACAHERVVVAEREGPAPGRVARAGDLRALLRARARALRQAPHRPLFLPSGTAEIQRPAAPEVAAGIPGPVQARGDHLVLLRDEQLIVVDTRGGLRVVATAALGHVYRAALLRHGDQILAVLPRLRRDGSADLELRRFVLGPDGSLARRDAVHLRGGADGDLPTVRVVGDALAILLQSELGRPTAGSLDLPAIWRAGRWRRLVRPTELQRPVRATSGLLTRVRCELGDAIRCSARGVVAPSTFFVAADDEAFVAWTRGALWRLPIADAPATAVRVAPGYPLDLLAWRLERGDVDAVVRADDGVALVHVPAAALRAGLTRLPGPPPLAVDERVAVRFVGRHLLHGDHPSAACEGAGTLHVRPLDGGGAIRLALPHCVNRIEPAGDHALVFAAPDHPWDAAVRVSAVAVAAATPGDARDAANARADSTRARGPFRLGGPRGALHPRQGAPLDLFTRDGPRLIFHAGPAGRDPLELAFHHAGRMYAVRDEELLELGLCDGAAVVVHRLALPCPPADGRSRVTRPPRCRR
jgi:hypothetical protein